MDDEEGGGGVCDKSDDASAVDCSGESPARGDAPPRVVALGDEVPVPLVTVSREGPRCDPDGLEPAVALTGVAARARASESGTAMIGGDSASAREDLRQQAPARNEGGKKTPHPTTLPAAADQH